MFRLRLFFPLGHLLRFRLYGWFLFGLERRLFGLFRFFGCFFRRLGRNGLLLIFGLLFRFLLCRLLVRRLLARLFRRRQLDSRRLLAGLLFLLLLRFWDFRRGFLRRLLVARRRTATGKHQTCRQYAANPQPPHTTRRNCAIHRASPLQVQVNCNSKPIGPTSFRADRLPAAPPSAPVCQRKAGANHADCKYSSADYSPQLAAKLRRCYPCETARRVVIFFDRVFLFDGSFSSRLLNRNC